MGYEHSLLICEAHEPGLTVAGTRVPPFVSSPRFPLVIILFARGGTKRQKEFKLLPHGSGF